MPNELEGEGKRRGRNVAATSGASASSYRSIWGNDLSRLHLTETSVQLVGVISPKGGLLREEAISRTKS